MLTAGMISSVLEPFFEKYPLMSAVIWRRTVNDNFQVTLCYFHMDKTQWNESTNNHTRISMEVIGYLQQLPEKCELDIRYRATRDGRVSQTKLTPQNQHHYE